MTPDELRKKLEAPLPWTKWKPQQVKGNKAYAVPYVDARDVAERLDDVFGPLGWDTEFTPVGDGSMFCRLTVRLDGTTAVKTDIGAPSDQPDEGDRTKAAASDGLKRAAVQLGIGRYLYGSGKWVGYDATNKKLIVPGQGQATHAPAPTAEVKPTAPVPQPTAAPAAQAKRKPTGKDLAHRLEAFDRELAAAKLIEPGDLVHHVRDAGVKAQYGTNIASWTGPAIAFGIDAARDFAARVRHLAGVKAAG